MREVLGVELFYSEAMGEHIDNLGDADTGALKGEFTACPVRP